MSMYESGEKINTNFKRFFEITYGKLQDEEKKLLIDTILWFGKVAKFRCRNNIAFANFSKICFENIAEIDWEKIGTEFGSDFNMLKVQKILEGKE